MELTALVHSSAAIAAGITAGLLLRLVRRMFAGTGQVV